MHGHVNGIGQLSMIAIEICLLRASPAGNIIRA